MTEGVSASSLKLTLELDDLAIGRKVDVADSTFCFLAANFISAIAAPNRLIKLDVGHIKSLRLRRYLNEWTGGETVAFPWTTRRSNHVRQRMQRSLH